ncbi:MAG: tetratricopeptide repeat protein [Symploca sp. SIO2E6]|nr:tetratricopeptide repeat protein [Symploca sp. SIO2E6]
MHQLHRTAESANFITAYINKSDNSVPQAMSRIAENFQKQGYQLPNFSQRYSVYLQKKEEIEVDTEAPQGLMSLVNKSLIKARLGIPKHTATVIGGVTTSFVDEEAIAAQIGEWKSYFAKRCWSTDEILLVCQPQEVLTPLFLQDIGEVAEEANILLFLDNYEDTGSFLDGWLREFLLDPDERYGILPLNLIIVIAGTKELSRIEWRDYENNIVRWFLEPFTEDEAKQYLESKGITNPSVVNEILRLSERLPFWLEHLATKQHDNLNGNSPPSQTALEYFLKGIDDPKRLQVALDVSLSPLISKDIVAVLHGEESADELFNWLKSRPFVKEHTDGYSYQYHEILRTEMLKQRRGSYQSWIDLHGKLASYYENRYTELKINRQQEWHGSSCQIYFINSLYHYLCQNPNQKLSQAINAFLTALEKNFFSEPAQKCAETITLAGKASALPELQSLGEQLLELLKAFNENYYEVGINLITQLLEQYNLDQETRARALSWRGESYRLIGIYEKALEDFNHAIEINFRNKKIPISLDLPLTPVDLEPLAENIKNVSWLHLTDFHQGMKEQNWLWPGVREIFLEDLKRLHEKCGPWDLVLFTGDLTQRGSEEEFRKLDEVLKQLWEHFEQLGSSPKLLAVPGNHDLVRPNPKDPTIRMLQQWSDQPDIQDEFWEEASSPYRQAVTQAFANYSNWWDRQAFVLEGITPGILPGDFSVTLEKDGARLGILGLNSSFLQLTGSNYEGQIALHARQFHTACDGDGSAWTKQHHTCLLLTHHPPAWLNHNSRQHLMSEITSHGRFAVHLCGHMHDVIYQEMAEGGTATQRTFQGRSLFGLEYFGEGGNQRLHGYTAGKIQLHGDTGQLYFWPREARLQGRQRSIVPDYSLELTDNQHTNSRGFKLLQPYNYRDNLAEKQLAIEQQTNSQQDAQCLPLNVGGTSIIVSRSSTYRKLYKYQESLQDCNWAVEINPKDPRAFTSRGETYLRMKQYKKALQDFDRAIELNPEDSWSISSRGKAYRTMRKFKKALRDFNRAIELNPEDSWSISSRGETYQQMRQYKEALHDFNYVMQELDIKNEFILSNRGFIYRNQGLYDQALTDYNCAIELNPSNSRLFASRGETYRLMKQYDFALEDFSHALNLKPNDSWTFCRRAETYLLLKQYDQSLADFQQTVTLDPNNDWRLFTYSLALKAAGYSDQAGEKINLSIQIAYKRSEKKQKDYRTSLTLALYYLAADHCEQAKQLYDEALSKNLLPALIQEAIRGLNYFLKIFPNHQLGQSMMAKLLEKVKG